MFCTNKSSLKTGFAVFRLLFANGTNGSIRLSDCHKDLLGRRGLLRNVNSFPIGSTD